MIKVAFLINPISGKNRNNLEFRKVPFYFDKKDYQVEINYSSSKNDLERLAKDSIDRKFNIIVACGGDGTVNTIAKYLVGTNIKLAILPRGSGNGLATHLNLGKALEQLCTSIKKSNYIKIDCGFVNGRHFFSNFALGYPADVIHRYDKDPNRGLAAYTKHSFQSFFAKKSDHITIEDSNENVFCVLVSNTKFLGYNMSLTPKALINNGHLEMVTAKSRGNLLIKMASTILFRKDHATRLKEITIAANGLCAAQLDGEPTFLKSPYNISVKASCLKVIVNA